MKAHDRLLLAWNSLKAGEAADDQEKEEKLDSFCSQVERQFTSITVSRVDDHSWWNKNSSLFEIARITNADGIGCSLLFSRYGSLVCGLDTGPNAISEKKDIEKLAQEFGFFWMPSTLLSEKVDGEDYSWRSALFSEC